MLTLIMENLWVFLLALVIGLATAWWVWGRAPRLDADWDGNAKVDEVGETVSDGLGKIGAGITGAVGGVAAAGAAGLSKVGDMAGDAVDATVDGAKAAGTAVVDGVSATGALVTGAVSNLASAGTNDTPVGLMGDTGAAPKPNIKAAVGAPDNLELLKGVGPKLNALLVSLGVTRFDQIAEWSAEDIAEVDGHLGNFKGRVTRDNWIEQARLLASGDIAGFEAKYGALGSEM